MTQTSPTEAGWYPDPGDLSQERYWMGADWSATLTRPPPASPPPSAWGAAHSPAPPAVAAPAPKRSRRKIVGVVVGVLVLVVIGVVAASGSSHTSGTSGTASAVAALTPAAYKASAASVTATQLANDPSSYKGDAVTFAATVVNFLQDSSGNTAAMNVIDPNDATSVVYVQLSGYADVARMNKGDAVTIWGDGQGDISDKNAFGATIHESAVTEDYLSDATSGYVDSTDPNPS